MTSPMGRGSDTRLFNPRSESTRMFGSGEDDEVGHAHGEGDPEITAQQREKKRDEKEQKKHRQRLHHLKIQHKDILDMLPEDGKEVSQEGDLELGNNDEAENEISALTGASGSSGAMLDQAVGAKTGTGSALGGTPPLLGPMGVYRSDDAMELAWNELTIRKDVDKAFPIIPALVQGARAVATKVAPKVLGVKGAQSIASGGTQAAGGATATGAAQTATGATGAVEVADEVAAGQEAQENAQQQQQQQQQAGQPQADLTGQAVQFREQTHADKAAAEQERDARVAGQIATSEPMDYAWSLLSKSKKDDEGPTASGEIGTAGTTIARRKEQASKWAHPRFKGAPGGRRPWTATSRRAKARSRTLSPRHRVHDIKGGLMSAPLAVHMSHLGVQTKQPMRQFPEKYRQYYGQQLRRRLQGNVALPYSPHGIMGERSQTPGPTGGGILPGQLPGQAASARMPSMRRLARPRVPRLHRPTGFNPMTPPSIPRAPSLPQPAQVGLPSSSIQMSDKVGVGSSLQKNLDILRPGTFSYLHSREIAKLLRELKEAMKRQKMQKSKDVSGAGETKPKHPANSPSKTTRLEGATETPPDQDARLWGMEPSAMIGAH